MTIIVAHDTPDAIRGMLKRWFIEPRPNYGRFMREVTMRVCTLLRGRRPFCCF